MHTVVSSERAPADPAEPGVPVERVRPLAWFAAGVVIVALLLSAADRQIITVLVDPMRRDLGISDSQIGLLQGLGFVGLHVIATIAAAWLAERYSRKLILVCGIVFWSAMTAASGLVSSFAALLALRGGVGAGEATVVPAGYSLVSDLFPARRRGLAMGMLTVATSAGTGISILLIGLLLAAIGDDPQHLPLVGTLRPWQCAFLLLGLLGVPVALIALPLRDPRHTAPKAVRPAQEEPAPAPTTLPASPEPAAGAVFAAHMRRHRGAMVAFFLLVSFNSLAGISLTSWLPTAIIRRFGATPSETAYLIGTVMFIGGSAALPAAALSDRWAARRLRGSRLHMHGPAYLLAAAGSLVAGFGPTPLICALGYLVCSAAMCGAFAIHFAAVQDITPRQAHPRALALTQLCVMAGGHVLGAFLAAFINDHVFADPAKINIAMAMVSCPTYLAAGAAAMFVRSRYYQLQADAEAASRPHAA